MTYGRLKNLSVMMTLSSLHKQKFGLTLGITRTPKVFLFVHSNKSLFFLEYDKSMKSSNSFRIPNLLQIRGTEKYNKDIFGQRSKNFDQNFRPAGIFNDRLSYESFSANNQTEKVRLEFSEVFGEPAWIIKSLKNDEVRFYSNEAVENPVDVSIWMFLKSVDVDNSQRYKFRNY